MCGGGLREHRVREEERLGWETLVGWREVEKRERPATLRQTVKREVVEYNRQPRADSEKRSHRIP